jgi:hypothetical protein
MIWRIVEEKANVVYSRVGFLLDDLPRSYSPFFTS